MTKRMILSRYENHFAEKTLMPNPRDSPRIWGYVLTELRQRQGNEPIERLGFLAIPFDDSTYLLLEGKIDEKGRYDRSIEGEIKYIGSMYMPKTWYDRSIEGEIKYIGSAYMSETYEADDILYARARERAFQLTGHHLFIDETITRPISRSLARPL